MGANRSFERELATESWTLYGIGMLVVLLRTFARIRRAGSASLLAPDDWFMMTIVPALYTTLIVCLNRIASGGGSNLYLPELFDTFSDQEIQERINGSKIVIVSEQAMLNVIWTLKACMLFMYARMTDGSKHRRYVKYLAIYVALGWIAVEITFFTACRPFKGYWGMPPPNPQCTTLEHYAMVQASFNLSSDFFMLLIPLPMFLSLSLPIKQKIVLSIVFSMGIFVIIAAILTKVYNLSDVYSTVYMFWYIREASVAVYVANLPGIWPLLREHIRFLRNHTSYPRGSTALPQYGNASIATRSRKFTTRMTTAQNDDEVELAAGRRSFSKSTTRSLPRGGSPESDERVMEDCLGGSGKMMNLKVHVDKTIEVQRSSWDGNGSERKEGWEIGPQTPKVVIEGPNGKTII